MVSKVAEIRFPWPKRRQAWYRQENLPRKPRGMLWDLWVADQGLSFKGHQLQAATSIL